MNVEIRKHAEELLKGSYDTHVHTAPSHFPRKYDDFEFAELISRYGMAGAVIKKHFGPTTDRAELVNRHGGFLAKLYGSCVLDWPSGGLNPYAVQAEMSIGCKIIYLPTFSADGPDPCHPLPVGGPAISIYDEEGKIRSEVYEIMDVVKQYDGVLCTGHLKPEEGCAVTEAGLKYGCRMMITHPDGNAVLIPVEKQIELTKKGAFTEKCWLDVYSGKCAREAFADSIRKVGPEHVVMCTDFGQKKSPDEPEGMLDFIELLIESGFTDSEIRQMNTTNAAGLLKV